MVTASSRLPGPIDPPVGPGDPKWPDSMNGTDCAGQVTGRSDSLALGPYVLELGIQGWPLVGMARYAETTI